MRFPGGFIVCPWGHEAIDLTLVGAGLSTRVGGLKRNIRTALFFLAFLSQTDQKRGSPLPNTPPAVATIKPSPSHPPKR